MKFPKSSFGKSVKNRNPGSVSQGMGIVSAASAAISTGITNPIIRVITKIDGLINSMFTRLGNPLLDRPIDLAATSLYIWKVLLFIVLVLIIFLDLLSSFLVKYVEGDFTNSFNNIISKMINKYTLFWLYTVCGFVNQIIIIIGTLIGIGKAKNSNYDGQPFQIKMIASMAGSARIFYELIPLVALSSIVLVYYSQKCGLSKPNTIGFGSTFTMILMILTAIAFLVPIIFKYLQKVFGGDVDNLMSPNTIFIFLANYYLVSTLIFSTEKTISNNFKFWLDMGTENEAGDPGKNCIDDYDNLPKDESAGGFKKILNIIFSVVLIVLLSVILVLGVLPIPTVMRVNQVISKGINTSSELVIGAITI